MFPIIQRVTGTTTIFKNIGLSDSQLDRDSFNNRLVDVGNCMIPGGQGIFKRQTSVPSSNDDETGTVTGQVTEYRWSLPPVGGIVCDTDNAGIDNIDVEKTYTTKSLSIETEGGR